MNDLWSNWEGLKISGREPRETGQQRRQPKEPARASLLHSVPLMPIEEVFNVKGTYNTQFPRSLGLVLGQRVRNASGTNPLRRARMWWREPEPLSVPQPPRAPGSQERSLFWPENLAKNSDWLGLGRTRTPKFVNSGEGSRQPVCFPCEAQGQ